MISSAVAMAKPAQPKRKFRFDSFASEFDECKKESGEDVPDNDSGIGKFFSINGQILLLS